MLNSAWLFIPIALQGIVTVVDEVFFHWKRGLPRWERVGHPLDTLTMLSCMLWILCVPPGPTAGCIYAGLALFSSVFVTKDERVHKLYCPAGEHWLHAVLFTLHPLALISLALLWPAARSRPSDLAGLILYSGWERGALWAVFAMALLFGTYQLVYWNFVWHSESMTR